MRQNTLLAKNVVLALDLEETVITNPFLSQNDGKHRLSEKRSFGPRFRQTVITNKVLTENEAKRNLHQKSRFSTRFRATVISNPGLT